jgi:indole-3-glycerol phosphate synthase
MKTATILDTIVAAKRRELGERKEAVPLKVLKRRVAEREAARDFAGALKQPGTGLIAEAKKASPSKGLLCPDFDAVRLARTYERAGAAAVSVLTEAEHFLGSLDYLTAVKETVSIPVLRKDFIFDPYQVYESAAAGADVLLLIAAMLTAAQLKRLHGLTADIGLASLVEVHNEAEMKRAIEAGAGIIGINNRDLRTFEVDLGVTEKLAPLAPPEAVIVSESGVRTREDIRRLADAGIDAVLVGETLITCQDIPGTIRELLHDEN